MKELLKRYERTNPKTDFLYWFVQNIHLLVIEEQKNTERLKELIAIEQDYKDLVIKLKEANKHPLVNVTLNQFHIIVSKL